MTGRPLFYDPEELPEGFVYPPAFVALRQSVAENAYEPWYFEEPNSDGRELIDWLMREHPRKLVPFARYEMTEIDCFACFDGRDRTGDPAVLFYDLKDHTQSGVPDFAAWLTEAEQEAELERNAILEAAHKMELERQAPPVGDLDALTRTVSKALTTAPWLHELELDAKGWVTIDSLLEALRRERPAWSELSEGSLYQMNSQGTKERLHYHATNGRIRGFPERADAISLSGKRSEPPALLYHGISPACAARIRGDGLRPPIARRWVHLSPDRETAEEVARHKGGEPVVLEIRAGEAYGEGIPFYRGNEMVWLADRVPPEFID